jgi:hypothetical protein
MTIWTTSPSNWGESSELGELREQLVARPEASPSFKRNELITAGSRPTWVSKEEIEERVGYSKGSGAPKNGGLRSGLKSTPMVGKEGAQRACQDWRGNDRVSETAQVRYGSLADLRA